MSALAITVPQAGADAANDPPFDVDPPKADAPAEAPAAAAESKEPATGVALREVAANIAEFDAVEAGLQALETKHGGVIFDVQTPKGFKAAKEARLACRDPRYAVQNAVKNAKAPLNNLKAAIAARGEAIIARITAVETPIDAQVKAEEKRLADEKARLEREAAERKAEIDEALREITSRVEACINQPSGFIAETLAWIDDTEVTEEDFGDRIEEAKRAVQETRVKVAAMLDAARQIETAAAAAKLLADQVAAQAAELAEREAAIARREKIGERIELIYTLPDSMVESDSGALRAAIASLDPLDPVVYGSRLREAQRAADAVLPELRALLDAAVSEEEAEPEEQEPEPQDDVPARDDSGADSLGFALPKLPEWTADQPAPVFAPAPAPVVEAPAPSRTTRSYAAPRKEHRPTDDQLIEVICLHFRVDTAKAIEWIKGIDTAAALARAEELPF
ncbi:hypothetical protein [Variovorax sp. dw_954]|uniref:hypothetical protein n=1 Tax=Variovorax sp. dw_954 TaxID=2720078 RepID=UPI001BD4BFF1|nr:hypothetical protein [Variovorax sp. dw_954]